MKRSRQILTVTSAVLGGMMTASGAYAAASLKYQDEVDVEFTFLPTLSMAISNDALTIANLAPGNAADSNEIEITVDTNNVAGYNLTATVGSNTTKTNTSNLVRGNAPANAEDFVSVATNANLSSLTTDSTWGFVKSTNGGTNWSTYNGLALYTAANGTELNATTAPASSSVTKFKIGAKASTSQYVGTYTNIINFTAVTNVASMLTIGDISTLQDFSADARAIVASMDTYDGTNNNAVYTLTDSRDGTTYHVAKLADGNVWLLDNLALDVVDKIDAMNPTNTNASSTTLGYLKNGGGTTSDKYATAGVANWTSSYSYSVPLVNMASKDVVPSDSLSQAGSWKVGGYYNYCAASAGSYCYGNGTSAGTSSGNATEDICPKGWRMPTGGASGEYQALATAITGTVGDFNDTTKYNNFRNALKAPLSGFFGYGSAGDQGSYGSFWLSTRSDSSSMHSFSMSTATVYPRNNSNRFIGYSVRCVLSY